MPLADLWKDVLAPLVSVAGALSAYYFALRSSRMQRENLRIQRDNDVLKWGNDAIDILSKLESMAFVNAVLPELNGEFYNEKRNLMARLSATIDVGRMYFPNVARQTHGTHKDHAFQGFRRVILSTLTHSYSVAKNYKFGEPDDMHAIRVEINMCRRSFVSELQKAVDPDRRLRFLATHGAGQGFDEAVDENKQGRRP
jgi:hypothetical protein